MMLDELLTIYSTEADQVAFLSDLAAAHPYFAPAQFALLQRTPLNSEVYPQRAATTALLFDNPYWLQFQLDRYNADQKTAWVPPAQNQSAAPDTATATTTAPADPTPEVTADKSTAAAPAWPLPPAQEPAMVSSHQPDNRPDKTDNDLPPMTISIPGPEAATATELSFEPLYMVDYFASQGIKLGEDLQANDKLGRQLKSFTEWLKSMKKTHPEATADLEASTADIAVQSMAIQSNKPDNVITESMAEVLALQGKRQKAIAIYEKLSLLNPGKSAYFAAKIQHLKGN